MLTADARARASAWALASRARLDVGVQRDGDSGEDTDDGPTIINSMSVKPRCDFFRR
jgi:hypothetical protein